MIGNTQLSLAGQSSSETMLSMMKHTVKLFIEVMKHDVILIIINNYNCNILILIVILIIIILILNLLNNYIQYEYHNAN